MSLLSCEELKTSLEAFLYSSDEMQQLRPQIVKVFKCVRNGDELTRELGLRFRLTHTEPPQMKADAIVLLLLLSGDAFHHLETTSQGDEFIKVFAEHFPDCFQQAIENKRLAIIPCFFSETLSKEVHSVDDKKLTAPPNNSSSNDARWSAMQDITHKLLTQYQWQECSVGIHPVDARRFSVHIRTDNLIQQSDDEIKQLFESLLHHIAADDVQLHVTRERGGCVEK
jgi:hypothetical protein